MKRKQLNWDQGRPINISIIQVQATTSDAANEDIEGYETAQSLHFTLNKMPFIDHSHNWRISRR